MKKPDLNFLYRRIKRESELCKISSNPEVRLAYLHGIYKSAYMYVKHGGKRDIDKFLDFERG